MSIPKNPRRADLERPDENNHPGVEDNIPEEEQPIGDPENRRPEEFPGEEDEPEPITTAGDSRDEKH